MGLSLHFAYIMRTMEPWDVFISHATPDKAPFVLPLAEALRQRGVRVWLDKWEIQLGDSISESISTGLMQSRFGIVVLSPAFFARNWPKKELAALFAREASGSSHIIPIWHEVDHGDVLANAPLLADRMAANSVDGIDSIVDRIQRLLARHAATSAALSVELVQSMTRRLFPALPVDEFWQTQLLADLDTHAYRSAQDVERAVSRGIHAALAFKRDAPHLFTSGTDHVTKALGFADPSFRSRHSWSPSTRRAFVTYGHLVRAE